MTAQVGMTAALWPQAAQQTGGPHFASRQPLHPTPLGCGCETAPSLHLVCQGKVILARVGRSNPTVRDHWGTGRAVFRFQPGLHRHGVRCDTQAGGKPWQALKQPGSGTARASFARETKAV